MEAQCYKWHKRSLSIQKETYMLRRVYIPLCFLFHTPGEICIPVVSSFPSKCATVFLVRESDHTMALQKGPVLRLHATVVSRWFVIPMTELFISLERNHATSSVIEGAPVTLTLSLAHPDASNDLIAWLMHWLHVAVFHLRCDHTIYI